MRQTILLGLMAVMLSGPAHAATLCVKNLDELEITSWFRDVGRLQELLDAGARVNERCNVRVAGTTREEVMSPDMLREYPTIQATPLHLAAWMSVRSIEVIQVLLDAGAQVNSRFAVDGETPLFFAADVGNFILAKVLLDAGANVNARNTLGNTPLHKAAISVFFNETIFQVLLDAGARINAKNYAFQTPLGFHIFSDGPDLSHIFIEAGGR